MFICVLTLRNGRINFIRYPTLSKQDVRDRRLFYLRLVEIETDFGAASRRPATDDNGNFSLSTRAKISRNLHLAMRRNIFRTEMNLFIACANRFDVERGQEYFVFFRRFYLPQTHN